MKKHTWAVSNGQIVKVGPFSHGLSACEVQAATKGEALALMLADYERLMSAPSPALWVRNAGYVFAYADPRGGFCVEGGTLHPKRARSDGSARCLVSAHADKLSEAPAKGSLDYYGSAEFQAEQDRAYGAQA